MSKVMTAKNFVAKAKDIANNYKTLYVLGSFGSPMTASNKKRFIDKNDYNGSAARKAKINAATSDTFGFDCSCLIKGILWGWSGDKKKTNGGATYKSNGVKDIGADTMITSTYCDDVSTNFKNIKMGEVVWTPGHIGIYIGNGLAIEATPAWKGKVQITAVKNIGTKEGYNARTWKKHGKLKYIDYSTVTTKKSITTIAKEVIDGKWGNGTARKTALTKAGYNYNEVQAEVNKLLKEAKSATVTHVVKKGDTLWDLAVKYYGNGNKYTEIKKLNNLKTDTLKIGQKLIIKK